MAKKSVKQIVYADPEITSVEAEPVVLSTMGNMAAVLTAAPAAAKGATAVSAAMLAAGVAVGSMAGVVAARNVVARTASLGNVPAAMAAHSYILGRACKVRVPYTLACFNACSAMLAKGPQTAASLALASTGDFVRYAVKNGWLVAAE